jgi:hypothetical protein
VRDLLTARYPDRYQSLPLLQALQRVHRTPRVYAAPNLLYDPQTGEVASTLGPRVEPAMASASRAPGDLDATTLSREGPRRRLGTRPRTRLRRSRAEP